MPSQLTLRRRNLLRGVTLVLVALAPAPAAEAAAPLPSRQSLEAPQLAAAPVRQQDRPRARPSTAYPKLLQPRGYDPYYRVPAQVARPDATASADNPSGSSMAISIAITLSLLIAIAAHVRWTRTRRRAHRVLT